MSTTSEPKTRDEILKERLRDVNSRLSIVKTLMGTDVNHHTEKLDKAEKRRKLSKGEARFVKIGSCMVEATDRLAALLEVEEAVEALLGLEGKNPVKEAEGLLAQKIRIIKELIPYAKSDS